MTFTRFLFDVVLLGIGLAMIAALIAARKLMNESAKEIHRRNARLP